ncbi:hypothetical protein [Haloferula rosea]|uniref:Uncharacterized protein n=1 Tax=Haloferula rosea TaxID=490093 RepID=A0A934RBW3_9BACT|nr:hypothetical protein [Haloferula rosea]MBK1826151.1 hypothetical protein [Haloferula rosea]
MRGLKAMMVCVLLHVSVANGQEDIVTQGEVSIPEPILNPAPAEPVPESEPVDFTVLTTRTTRMDVADAPPMTGLPPVEGAIDFTIRLVEDPKLPDPPPRLPALPPDDPEVVAALDELARHYKRTEMLFVSATVYDKTATLLRIHPSGDAKHQITAWSNLDFTCFSGFSTFRVTGQDGEFTDYGMLMGLGIIDTGRMREAMELHGLEYDGPTIPELPDLVDAGPAFVVVGGNAEGMGMDTLKNLHDLYRNEGDRMQEAQVERTRIRKERIDFFLANPPRPDDVTISFWRRDKPQADKDEGR